MNITHKHTYKKLWLAISTGLALSLTACGGGSDSNSGHDHANPPIITHQKS
ncbi:hypothetical protein [Moraxella macacae]|uniref:hypothetical protein n=1 Tax=Moraxella macacae TaxID=765840 RepID=UPI000314F445|nr:hypothetical protein [Moraxella macacae]